MIQIIYLNGPSSSGKTTLVKALQEALDEPFLHMSIDRMIAMMPEKINNWTGGDAPQGFSWKQAYDASGHLIHELQAGPFAKKISRTLIDIVATVAQNGHFVIIDDVSFGKEEVDLWKKGLKNFNVLWVGLKAPLATLEAREQARANRMQGSARAQATKVHENVIYDLVLDTSQLSLADCVLEICKRVK